MSFCLNCQLSSAIKDRENSWRKQKREIEEHYSNLIKDLHTRTQVQYTLLFLCLTSRQELVCSCERGWRRSNKNHAPKPITISSNFKFFSNCFLSFLVFPAVLLTGFCVSCDLLEYWVSLSWFHWLRGNLSMLNILFPFSFATENPVDGRPSLGKSTGNRAS